MYKRERPRLRLVVDNSVLLDTRLNRHVLDAELPIAEHLDLVCPEIRNDSIPHGDGFPGAAESIGERLMGTPEMLQDVLKLNGPAQMNALQYGPSVSALPSPVKPLTRRANGLVRKLAYMSKKRKPTDEWAIKRGAKMKKAREDLGYSQQAVADLCEIKDRETISQYESGLIKEIDAPQVPRLSIALGLPISDLSRIITEARDEGADLRVSTVARSLAYNFDRLPLMLQTQIRQLINVYESSVTHASKERSTDSKQRRSAR